MSALNENMPDSCLTWSLTDELNLNGIISIMYFYDMEASSLKWKVGRLTELSQGLARWFGMLSPSLACCQVVWDVVSEFGMLPGGLGCCLRVWHVARWFGMLSQSLACC